MPAAYHTQKRKNKMTTFHDEIDFTHQFPSGNAHTLRISRFKDHRGNPTCGDLERGPGTMGGGGSMTDPSEGEGESAMLPPNDKLLVCNFLINGNRLCCSLTDSPVSFHRGAFIPALLCPLWSRHIDNTFRDESLCKNENEVK